MAGRQPAPHGKDSSQPLLRGDPALPIHVRHPDETNATGHAMNSWETLWRVLKPPYLRNSLVVALVVGALLNLINQGDALAGQAPISWSKLTLTFLVPFLCLHLRQLVSPERDRQEALTIRRHPWITLR